MSGLVLSMPSACGRNRGAAPRAPGRYVAAFSFAVVPVEVRQQPGLFARLTSSPHAYFRFINDKFGALVCDIYGSNAKMPNVNLHGDPHVEQYVVTENSRGLSDYDDTTTGPPVIDILRFKTSLVLVARQRGWEAVTLEALQRFDAGYRHALQQPTDIPGIPAFAERMRDSHSVTHAEAMASWMALIDGCELDRATADEQLRGYVTQMRERYPDLPAEFFRVKRAGPIQLGIGSALRRKLLFRIEGPSSSDEDDMVIEAKEVSDLSRVPCVAGDQSDERLRVLVGQSRIAYVAWKYAGSVDWKDSEGTARLWVHEWEDSYGELALETTLMSPTDLVELAYDVGFQLGRGHPNAIAAPYDAELRRELLAFSQASARATNDLAFELADAVTTAWRDFAVSRRTM